jgi:hypothetical protein
MERRIFAFLDKKLKSNGYLQSGIKGFNILNPLERRRESNCAMAGVCYTPCFVNILFKMQITIAPPTHPYSRTVYPPLLERNKKPNSGQSYKIIVMLNLPAGRRVK